MVRWWVDVDGSSPLTRGKQRPVRRRRNRKGLIPAHAGKTTQCSAQTRCAPAHPRSRGENDLARKTRADASGSSPLTRGKPGNLQLILPPQGLIPAHAGKTVTFPWMLSWWRAHPRSRGENTKVNVSHSHISGSSPLTRGKHTEAGFNVALVGLIPAHAGKTTEMAAFAP